MMQLEDWLDDLCVRFLLNVPAEELTSWERTCFQIEEANWFYEDFIRAVQPTLPNLSLKPFFFRIIQRCPGYDRFSQQDLENAYNKFMKYKLRVPVRGAILLNDAMDQVLLVKGWKKNATWSFPRGKINKDEDDLDCAIREAWEETGFNIKTARLVQNRKKVKCIELSIRNQNMKMFVFRGVPQDFHFVPQTRKEISKIEWFRLVDLPTEKKKHVQHDGQLNANKFYVVAPFMHDLKKMIAAERKKDNRQSSRAIAAPVNAESVPLHDNPYIDANNLAGPIPPPLPSNLPEVNIIQHRIPQPELVTTPDAGNRAKSEKLLALLQRGPSNEMRNEPHTPLEQSSFAAPQGSPDRPPTAYLSQQPAILSPASEMPPSAHPAAPPTSALPQLSKQAQSLLAAFNSQPSPTTRDLPSAKQSLLAAFTAQAPSAASPAPPPADAGNSLLQLLQRKEKGPDPVQTQPPAPFPDSSAPTSAILPAPISVSAQPLTNNLLSLLQYQPPTETRTSTNHASYAAAASTKTPVVRSAAIEPDKDPIELSATGEDAPRLRNEKSQERVMEPRTIVVKARTGTTSATLDLPFDEPQFDSIPRANNADENPKREPVSGKKLFDPKHDQVKQLHGLGSRDERRPPRSPRTPGHKQIQTPRATPKQVLKPFQPQVTQILRRPQSSDGDALFASPAEFAEVLVPEISKEVSPVPTPVYRDPQKDELLALLRPAAQKRPSIDPEATPKVDPVPVMSPPTVSQIVSPILGEEPVSRSRVSSLASVGNAAPRPMLEKRQTAPGDKVFLMNLLKGYAGDTA